jgi:hypothetical protein
MKRVITTLALAAAMLLAAAPAALLPQVLLSASTRPSHPGSTSRGPSQDA